MLDVCHAHACLLVSLAKVAGDSLSYGHSCIDAGAVAEMLLLKGL